MVRSKDWPEKLSKPFIKHGERSLKTRKSGFLEDKYREMWNRSRLTSFILCHYIILSLHIQISDVSFVCS